MSTEIQRRYEYLLSRIQKLEPRALIDGEECRVKLSKYSHRFHVTKVPEPRIGSGVDNHIEISLDGGLAGSWRKQLQELRFRDLFKAIEPAFAYWQEVLPVVERLPQDQEFFNEYIHNLAGCTEYELCILDRDGTEIDLHIPQPGIFKDLPAGVYWLLVSAMSPRSQCIRVFIPVILGDWDGYFHSEHARREKGIEDWRNDAPKKSRVPKRVFDIHGYISSETDPWIWLHQQIDDYVAYDREHSIKRRSELLVAQSRVNTRISQYSLRLPRAPRNDGEFELIVRDWMIAFGHDDANVTRRGPDSGIDVFGSGFVAQVKFYSSEPIGREAIQLLKGASSIYGNVLVLFFAYASGYRDTAIKWADKANVALCVFDVDTQIFEPANQIAEEFFRVHGNFLINPDHHN